MKRELEIFYVFGRKVIERAEALRAGVFYRNRKREAKDFEKIYTRTDVLHEKRCALHRGVFNTVDYTVRAEYVQGNLSWS